MIRAECAGIADGQSAGVLPGIIQKLLNGFKRTVAANEEPFRGGIHPHQGFKIARPEQRLAETRLKLIVRIIVIENGISVRPHGHELIDSHDGPRAFLVGHDHIDPECLLDEWLDKTHHNIRAGASSEGIDQGNGLRRVLPCLGRRRARKAQNAKGQTRQPRSRFHTLLLLYA